MSAIGAAIAPFHSSSRLAERHLLFCVKHLRNTAKWLDRTARGGELVESRTPLSKPSATRLRCSFDEISVIRRSFSTVLFINLTYSLSVDDAKMMMDVKARGAYCITLITMAFYSEVLVAYVHLPLQSLGRRRC